MKDFDAIIVGAGPAGLLSALKLSEQGLMVLILDRLPEIRRKVCGEYLCPKGVELLKGESLEDLLSDFEPISGMNLFSPKGKKIKSFFLSQGRALDRKIFDQRLCEKAKSAGAIVHFGAQVVKIEKNNDDFHLVFLSDGSTYRTRLIVGADGRNSYVARHFGLTQHQKKHGKIALHAHLKSRKSNSRQGEMHLFSEGDYIGLDPTNEEKTNLTLVCDQAKLKEEKPLELICSYLEKSASLKERFELSDDEKIEMVYPLIHQTSAVTKDGVALVGDAAYFIDPLTGEGIYQALLSAKLFAENYKDLSVYSKKYQKVFRQKKILNTFFQFFIKNSLLVEALGACLIRSQKLANIFINVIGNIYTPLEGLFKLLPNSRR